ncbi:BBE domain-containing protein [Paraburkholderia sp. 2C]
MEYPVSPEKRHAAHGPNYQRLAAVKQRYASHNLFRKNQNIEPSGAR